MDVHIDVEYCRACGYKKQFSEMAEAIRRKVPTANINGSAGRRASFEVQVNGELVFSKLQTTAFPNYDAVSDVAEEVRDGKPIRKVERQQGFDCVIA